MRDVFDGVYLCFEGKHYATTSSLDFENRLCLNWIGNKTHVESTKLTILYCTRGFLCLTKLNYSDS